MKIRKTILIFISFLIIFTSTVFAAEVDETQILVPAAIMIETNTGKTLYEKNSNQIMYPASTTKIMTAIIVLEHCNLSEQTKVSFSAISEVPDGYETANLVVDEVLTIEELLNIMLIKSANDAANVLAEHVAGSIESFVSMMNTRAYELGCRDTHFTNPYGLHDEQHYSTAYDLYLIADHAMKNDTFRSIVKKGMYIVYPTNKYDEERRITNTNKLLNSSSSFYDKRVIGIKTGFTTPAGDCLVSCSSDNDMEIIIVVLGGGLTYEEPEYQQYSSTLALVNYAFDNYSYKTINEKNAYYDTIEVKNATPETKNLQLMIKDEITAFIENDESEYISKVELNETILAPIKAGDVLGKVTYSILGTDYTSDLIAANDVEVSKATIIIFASFVTILVAYAIYKIFKNGKRKRRR